jgi:kanamycin kinase
MRDSAAGDGDMEIAGKPPEGTRVPSLIVRLASEAHTELVWLNVLGGLTARVGDRYVKWAPPESGISFSDEAERLEWASAFHPVPEVISFGADDDGAWLETRAMDAESAVSARWLDDPTTAVRAIGEGLRALHENLPLEWCAFDSPGWTITPLTSDIVVSHGDACAPNTLISAKGKWAAHVDFGAIGPADRWSDLAIASMSLDWNFGPGWQQLFFDSYDIEPDADLIEHYRTLWDRG